MNRAIVFFLTINLTPLIEWFILITIAALGDKTEFAVRVLSAEYGFPLLTFIGAIMAVALVAGFGAVVGTALMKSAPLK